MITLTEEKINGLLASNSNNHCIECGNESVEWVSFPTSVFLCSKCCRLHKEFSKKETLKSLNMSEFDSKEISKLSVGGNERYLKFLTEYNISKDQPNIENKYLTVMTDYYNALLECEVGKLNNEPRSEELYQNLTSQKPSVEIGQQLLKDNLSYFNVENVNVGKKEDVFMGGFFGYIGNQLYTAAENLGINKAYNEAKTNLDNKIVEYGLKDKVDQTVDYAKKAGEFIIEKGKEIAEKPIVKEALEKVSEGVNNVKEQATNYINNMNAGNNANNNNNNSNNNTPNNAQPGSQAAGVENEHNAYQQLNNDQL